MDALISTTAEHLFYVKGIGFVNATELLDSNGDILSLEKSEIGLEKNSATVYNLQVEDFHTYHVSELGVLVHNAGDYIKENRVPKDNETILKNKREYARTSTRKKVLLFTKEKMAIIIIEIHFTKGSVLNWKCIIPAVNT